MGSGEVTGKAAWNARERRIALRRSVAGEAVGHFCGVFTLGNVVTVAWEAMFKDTIDYEKAFMHGLILGLVWAGASIALKLKPVFLR
jgi:hypothetical protein